MVLFVNACIRNESRTRRLAEVLLHKLGVYEEINLISAGLRPLDEEALERRSKYCDAGDFDHPMFDCAKQFAAADVVVIAAPFWDWSFPAVLKTYFENIYVTGLVSRYGEDGRPIGMCKASKMYFVTTAGGPYIPDFSYNYVKQLVSGCFGIQETQLIKAEMLDVGGFDAEKILLEAEAAILQDEEKV